MGAWNTGIFDNDYTMDVRGDFLEYLEEGYSAFEASVKVINEWDDLPARKENLVYVGLAAIQLEKGNLVREVKNDALSLIKLEEDSVLKGDVKVIPYIEFQVLKDFSKKLRKTKSF